MENSLDGSAYEEAGIIVHESSLSESSSGCLSKLTQWIQVSD